MAEEFTPEDWLRLEEDLFGSSDEHRLEEDTAVPPSVSALDGAAVSGHKHGGVALEDLFGSSDEDLFGGPISSEHREASLEGCEVELGGLTKVPQMNGQRGRCVREIEGRSGWWVVRLDSGVSVNLKVENIERLVEPTAKMPAAENAQSTAPVVLRKPKKTVSKMKHHRLAEFSTIRRKLTNKNRIVLRSLGLPTHMWIITVEENHIRQRRMRRLYTTKEKALAGAPRLMSIAHQYDHIFRAEWMYGLEGLGYEELPNYLGVKDNRKSVGDHGVVFEYDFGDDYCLCEIHKTQIRA